MLTYPSFFVQCLDSKFKTIKSPCARGQKARVAASDQGLLRLLRKIHGLRELQKLVIMMATCLRLGEDYMAIAAMSSIQNKTGDLEDMIKWLCVKPKIPPGEPPLLSMCVITYCVHIKHQIRAPYFEPETDHMQAMCHSYVETW